jgi:hypothetical protein
MDKEYEARRDAQLSISDKVWANLEQRNAFKKILLDALLEDLPVECLAAWICNRLSFDDFAAFFKHLDYIHPARVRYITIEGPRSRPVG